MLSKQVFGSSDGSSVSRHCWRERQREGLGGRRERLREREKHRKTNKENQYESVEQKSYMLERSWIIPGSDIERLLDHQWQERN